jgi:hypothetical protein
MAIPKIPLQEHLMKLDTLSDLCFQYCRGMTGLKVPRIRRFTNLEKLKKKDIKKDKRKGNKATRKKKVEPAKDE